MTLQVVPPQCAQDSASNQGDSADDACFDDASDPGQSSTSYQCSLTGDLDDDDSWISPQDMALLKASNPDLGLQPRQQSRLRRLPKGTRPLRLIGEGAANAVFQLDGAAAASDLNGLLLRVAKVPSRNHAPTYNYLAQQRFYQTSIKPRLGEYAVQQELVILHKSGIVDMLNRLLQDIDSTRKKKFRGSLIGQTDWGFLVQDMRPQDPAECVLIEFKPKWLSQSPSAPKASVRCRQCATELRNLIRDPSGDRMLPEHKPCPLSLVNKDAPAQVSSPFRIAPHLARDGRSDHFRQVLGTIVNHPSIRDLKTQQDLLDKLGPLYAEPTDPFLIAMTLRDCTCFAQIHRRRQSVKIRMGDFDWKDPLVKFDSWRRAEQELIDGGFYTAERILCNGSYYYPPTFCVLEFSPGSHGSQPNVLDVQDRDEATVKVGDTSGAEAAGGEVPFSHKADVVALQKRLDRFKTTPMSDLAAALRERLSLSPG
ncbi:inositol-pentakisphosphate 2-kinase domain-containing protein [Hirsutella rhossiliensis]|uniref:Inositol-pentakisphosphate 2-kinase n=1 Tax=Hirsutella rhossiliensis TaxID=111463 RepID=A0A9P8MVP0_9HYPO|nr:inositol-pentakisphosphate 2-kinase domain-containing protein [Hirsutella rhossiliensis]KAH0962953.1 inositol-pentakisphosphate 2-kinase domain-containing protein [Hirsutella rhossiliensis]